MMTAYKEQYDMKAANRNKGIFVLKKLNKRFENETNKLQVPHSVENAARILIMKGRKNATTPIVDEKYFI